MREPKLGLVEHFYSIQGEGFNAGQAAFFIRFAGCNLDCVFADGSICDTPWRKAYVKISIPELLDWIGDTEPQRLGERPWIILTGGEPTMAPLFDALVISLREKFYPVAIETNGTRVRASFDGVDWIVVSPKNDITHRNPLGSPDLDEEIYYWADEVRYVVTGPDWALPDPDPWPSDIIRYLSPALMADGRGMEAAEGIVPAFAPGAAERAVEIVKDNPQWRLSLQTHKWLRIR